MFEIRTYNVIIEFVKRTIGGEYELITPRKKLVSSRKNLGLTQEELAKKADISRTYLVNIEAGKYTPSLDVAHRLSAILNMSVEDLFL